VRVRTGAGQLRAYPPNLLRRIRKRVSVAVSAVLAADSHATHHPPCGVGLGGVDIVGDGLFVCYTQQSAARLAHRLGPAGGIQLVRFMRLVKRFLSTMAAAAA
jgi:hypothetical protein